MFRCLFITPVVDTSKCYKTYSFLTGCNIYTGLGVHGILISVLGFGIVMEYITYGK